MATRPLSPFEQSENFALTSPRKKMRMPNFSVKGGATNVTPQEHSIGRVQRAAAIGGLPGFRGCTLWFTGFSGAGKTTISFGLEKALIQLGIPCYGLDGDNVRHGLCKNLGFSKEDRSENIRRVAEVAKLFADSGMLCLASFISPFKADRNDARRIHETDDLRFFEIHVDTSLEICESRDPKKLYKKARAGELRCFTGIDSEYEAPEAADLVLHAGRESERESVNRVLQFLYHKGILPEKAMQSLIGTPLLQLFVPDDKREEMQAEMEELQYEVPLSDVDLQWMQVLAEGWASPLPGFMRERQYLQSLHFGQLLDLKKKCVFPGEECHEEEEEEEEVDSLSEAINQSIPIVLTITAQQKDVLTNDGVISPSIALSHCGRRLAILRNAEIFPHGKRERAARQFGSVDERHPGVAQLMATGDYCIGGELHVLSRITFSDGLDEYRHTPCELRQILAEKGADSVFVFQLRNPIHNGHALLMRETRERLLQFYRNPVLILHPLGGWTKDDDVPLAVRMAQHEACLAEGVLGEEWTVLSIFPSPMLYAGPTEVQWHARARLAAGVHTYIVGRDPAGIADPAQNSGAPLYDASHGAKVLAMAPGLSHLHIIPFRVAAYDKKAGRMAMLDEKRLGDFDFISGTKMRSLAREGRTPPQGFMATKAWKVLADYYNSISPHT